MFMLTLATGTTSSVGSTGVQSVQESSHLNRVANANEIVSVTVHQPNLNNHVVELNADSEVSSKRI